MGAGWLHGGLLFTFSLHFLFVALTLGTGILATAYYVAGHWGRSGELASWDRDFLGAFFAHKSLAIVLGVGPILLMQVGHSIPFLTGVSVMAPWWMSIVAALIASLVLYEWQHRRTRERKWLYLVVSAAALACLVYVPCTFVCTLVCAERPHAWAAMLKAGSRFPREATVHAVLRLLHVLGSSVVVGGALHYVLQPKAEEQKRRHLLGWIAGGIAFQFVIGVALYGSVRPFPSALVTGAMLVGVAAAALLGFLTGPWRRDSRPNAFLVAVLVPFILIPMFLTRQLQQDRVLYPFEKALAANADIHRAQLAPYRGPALAAFRGSLATSYDNGLAIYSRSCGFCHGAVGNGQGENAGELSVPPEDLTRLRMGDDKLNRVLLGGIDGSAMPRFDFYLASELALLRTFLREKVGLRQAAERVDHALGAPERKAAADVFATTCSVCHGKDGRGSERGRALRPPVPDFTTVSFAASRAYQIVTQGYPGTLMRDFGDLPEDVRWALVERVQSFYGGGLTDPEPRDGGSPAEEGR